MRKEFLDAGIDWISILATPTEVFHGMRNNHRWFVATILSMIVLSLAHWSTLPLEQHIVDSAISRSFGTPLPEGGEVSRMMYTVYFWQEGARPVEWIIFAFSLFVLSSIASEKLLTFQHTFSIVAQSTTILALESVLDALYAHSVPLHTIVRVADLRIPSGLDDIGLFLRMNSEVLQILDRINLFSIWQITTVGIGISIVASISRRRAGLIAFLAWATMTGLSYLPNLIMIQFL